MRAHRGSREHGFSLVEALVGTLVAVVVVGIATSLLVSAKHASDTGQPMMARTWTRASALAEMTGTLRDSAARCSYFDLTGTIQSVVRGGGTSGPPPGYCLVIASDPATWPPGFDPHTPSTWQNVTWWVGATRDDPSTWYYDCRPKRTGATAPSPSTIPHELEIAPVTSYGTGILIAKTMPMVGPAAMLPESAGLGGAQRGQALVVLRTEPMAGALRLASALVTSGPVVRLAARDQIDRAAVEGLVAGDVLYITGRDSAGTVRTSLVGLRSAPQAVSVASPGVGAGNAAAFTVYEAVIEAPDATLLGYLGNGARTASGAEYLADASVALLARDGALVTYYTGADETGLHLFRAVGDPEQPAATERILENVAAPLSVETEPDAAIAGPIATTPEPLALVRIAVPTVAGAADATAEPVEAEIALLNSVGGQKPGTLVWDAIVENAAHAGDGK